MHIQSIMFVIQHFDDSSLLLKIASFVTKNSNILLYASIKMNTETLTDDSCNRLKDKQ